MSLPLDGIRVLDLSRYLPGPFCTQILADFGAEVIKVEDPRGGDLGRQLAPIIDGQSSRFYTVNRNKKSISLDLKKEEGKAIFKKLALNCDVVVDQFRPGVMDKMGLGYENLRALNERIIYCSLTGYGMTGPLRDAAGHDLNYLNLSGVTGLTGTCQGMPAMSGVQIADIAGGTLYSVIAILLALASRDKTGKGQLCDIAMMDGSVSLLAYTLGEWSGQGVLPQRGDEALTGGYACYNVYETKDNKHVSLAAVEDKFWADFCKKVAREGFIKLQWDKPQRREIMENIRTLMKEKTRDEWVAFFADSDICFTPVLTVEEMCEHPQVAAREMIIKVPDIGGSGHEVVLTGLPVKLSDTPGTIKLTFPNLGEHNEEILLAAGYTAAEIEEFHQNKVI